MKIESAQKDDHIILSDITYKAKAFWGYEKAQLEKWQEDLTISPEYITANDTYKLRLQEKIIGYYSVIKVEKETLKLDNIFVLPEYIGKGYGKILMRDCISKAKSEGFKKIILDAEPKAEGFYKKIGFETINQLQSSIAERFLPQMKLSII